MGTFVRVLAALLVIGLIVGIGAAVYNAGVSAGLADAAVRAAASGDAVPAPYAYGWGYGPYWHGPGFFGLFLLVLGLFVFVGLVRAAVGWGRHDGPRGHGGWGGRREMLEEMHRELHRREGSTGPSGERTAGA